jgi:hypothetical protein
MIRYAMIRSLLLLLSVCGFLAAQEEQAPKPERVWPKIVSRIPENLATTVDPATTELVVVFDVDMDRGGHSICGGGKPFPKFTARPQWQSPRKLLLTVELKPDVEYELSLNCSSARKIRSKAGTPLPIIKWQFTTLPANPRPVAEQHKRNEAAVLKLEQLLDERYSYRDRKIKEWAQLRAEHGPVLRAARTDRAFAVEAARMLGKAADMHLSVRYGETTYTTWKPLIDPLYRTFAVRRLFKLESISSRAYKARTKDGIGYLLIIGWQEEVDVERLVGAIAEMMDAKALVIDVRMNTGGDERIARQVASWFVEGTHVYARNRSRTGPGADGFGEIHDRKITGHDAAYDRPVAVLAGPRVMSANESFVLMMKQARDAMIVGQTTSGSSGNPKPHDLGNGITIMLPSWQALRPDGTCWEGEGIAPDVVVPCTSRDFKDRDPILDKALELLRAKIAKGK